MRRPEVEPDRATQLVHPSRPVEQTDLPGPSRREIAGVPTRLWPLVLVAAAIAAAATQAATGLPGLARPAWWLIPVFIGLFLIGEATQIHVQLRRETHSFSISEIPLVLGLYWLSPLALVGARIAAVLLINGARRTTPRKFVTNCSVAAAETAIASVAFAAIHTRDETDPKLWLAAILAVGLADCVSLAGIMAAITLYEGRLAPVAVPRLVIASVSVGVLNTTVGLILLIVLRVNLAALGLLVVLAVVLVAGYRAYSQFLAQHKSLGELYEFTRAVSTARQENNLADTMLTRTRELLSAGSATLWMPGLGRHPEIALTARVDQAGLVDEQLGEDPIRRHVLDTGVTVHLGPRAGPADLKLRLALRNRGAKDLIAVPLRSGTAVVGCLEVADRLHDLATFGSADVRLLETLAAHAAVAVENSRLVERLRYDAYHDAITGLPNRRRLVDAIEAAIGVEPMPDEVVALLEFDVAGLRGVNETLGHRAGDQLLAEVGRRLRTEAPDGALVARLGGDEFAVLVRTTGATAAAATAAALRRKAVAPFTLDGVTIDVGAAAGIAVSPDHATDAESLLRRADAATDAARTDPRGVRLYTASMEIKTAHRMGLVSELRRALDRDELIVHYQPKVALASRELVGVECLARWNHPVRGLVEPVEFVAAAEQAGLIGELTTRVLTLALSQCRRWQDAGRSLGVAVNVSARTLSDPEFPGELVRLLATAGVPPELLTIEIADSGSDSPALVPPVTRAERGAVELAEGTPPPGSSAGTEADRVLATLGRLAALGVRIALDDVGSGAASFGYLRAVGVQEIKIDRSLVLGMTTDGTDLGIVRAMVELGRNLGLTVVAEGVETELARHRLQEMGCHVAQGFLYSRPLPPERLDAWVAAQTEYGVEDHPTADGVTRRLRVVGENG